MGAPLSKWLKALGIFVLSAALAASIGLALSLVSPPSQCTFPVDLIMERQEGSIRAVINSVEGQIEVTDVEYRVVRLQGESSATLSQGNLTEAKSGEVVYIPLEPSSSVLQAGDYVTVDEVGEDVHLLLITHEGSPLGWTAGC